MTSKDLAKVKVSVTVKQIEGQMNWQMSSNVPTITIGQEKIIKRNNFLSQHTEQSHVLKPSRILYLFVHEVPVSLFDAWITQSVDEREMDTEGVKPSFDFGCCRLGSPVVWVVELLGQLICCSPQTLDLYWVKVYPLCNSLMHLSLNTKYRNNDIQTPQAHCFRLSNIIIICGQHLRKFGHKSCLHREQWFI